MRFPGHRLPLLLIALILAGGCASLPDNSARPASFAYTDTGDTGFGRAIAKGRQQHGGQDGFMLLRNGLDAFVERAVLARYAERSIDLQYYLYHEDMVGKLLLDQLLEAAERGVRVRMLIDDMDLGGRDRALVAIDSHPNIELRVFNPFGRNIGRGLQFVTGFGSLTRRMHNKSFTVDNQIAIVGGRNIGNEYFDADPTLEFADLDVAVIGDVVGEISRAFDLYWNSDLAYPASTLIEDRPTEQEIESGFRALARQVGQYQQSAYIEALHSSDLVKKLVSGNLDYEWGRAEVVYDHPEKLSRPRDQSELHLATQLEPHFAAIEDELIILSPYFVPGREGVEFLGKLVDRGVRVRILTNSLASNDVGVVHAGYAKYRKGLLRAGVELYELNKQLTSSQRREKQGAGGSSKASLHAKSFVLDRNKTFIGSLNLDPRSFYENSEIGVVIESEALAGRIADGFDQEIDGAAFRLELRVDDAGDDAIVWRGFENGEVVSYDVDPHTGFWRRFGISLMQLLPIESQL